MTTADLFSDTTPQEIVAFEPTRQAGLVRLEAFASRTGAHYAAERNYDYGPHKRSSVSALSPWIRHRLITEEEVLARTLARHGPSSARKFIEEVFWRGYFKGFLEQHPSVWDHYQRNLQMAVERLEAAPAQKADYEDAIAGRTGIDCFDHWCAELKTTGYLHNHARMWFASIWIFTLRLPWELGADFFLRHLLDADPASNTLSWRWVAGLHTKGKTYLARPSNIAKYTNGQFNPVGQLAPVAEPLVEGIDHPIVPLPRLPPAPQDDFLLLITSEDCQPHSVVTDTPAGVLGACLQTEGNGFPQAAVEDAAAEGEAIVARDWTAAIVSAAQRVGTRDVVTAYAPVGPVAAQLKEVTRDLSDQGISLHQTMRRYDALVWPYAQKGYFKLKKNIPDILSGLGLAL